MRALIIWFAKNPVAANILMVCLVAIGLWSLPSARKELIPNVALERIAIAVTYQGASPKEVESALCRPIENEIYDIEGIVEIRANASADRCDIEVEVGTGFVTRMILNDIKARIDAMPNLPESVQRPLITELKVRSRVISLILDGDVNETMLKTVAETIRKELLENPIISVIDINHTKDYELSIQVDSEALEKYQLSLAEIANIIRESSTNLPGGTLNTPNGDILIQTEGKAYTKNEFENIIIRSSENGAKIYLSDIANVVDGYSRDQTQAYFNSKGAVVIDVFRVGDQNIIDVANAVREYIENAKSLPYGVQLHIWRDDARHFESRINLLAENAFTGLALLFIVLYLFLNLKLSFWVSLGIPIAFIGAFPILPVVDGSINAISLFAFILVLGIVVDDAIIVGESIYSKVTKTQQGLPAAIDGAVSVSKPIVFSILTTIIAFLPLMFLPGPEGQLMKIIPIVVSAVLILSLVESLLILPSHLSNLSYQDVAVDNYRTIAQRWVSKTLQWVIDKVYRPLLDSILQYRLPILSTFIVALMLCFSLISSGWIKVVLFSEIEADFAVSKVVFSEGSSIGKTKSAIDRIKVAAEELKQEIYQETGEQLIGDILSVIAPRRKIGQFQSEGQSNIGQVVLELKGDKSRIISGKEIVLRWREKVGQIDDVIQLRFESNLGNPVPDIAINFYAQDLSRLKDAVEAVKKQMVNYHGVYEVRDNGQTGMKRSSISLSPVAKDMNISLEDIGSQIQQALQGIEIQRFNRGDEEVSVILRAPNIARESTAYLYNFPITVSPGVTVPLSHLANIGEPVYAPVIRRIDRKRSIQISAFVDHKVISAKQLTADLNQYLTESFADTYSDISWSITGKQRDIGEFLQVLSSSYVIAIVLIYMLMAVLFASYSQPFLVMFAIPFGMIGSLFGHWLIGVEVTLWSLVGMVAVSGVVVNDNLVLVHYINRCRAQGKALREAIIEAGVARFRPIILTSITTFISLTPMMLETSLQAQFLIPMAVSLAFGVMFATLITLILMPAIYLISDSVVHAAHAFFMRYQHRLRPIQAFSDLDEIYALGFTAGSSGKRKKPPRYRDEVCLASWEAGWADGIAERLQTVK